MLLMYPTLQQQMNAFQIYPQQPPHSFKTVLSYYTVGCVGRIAQSVQRLRAERFGIKSRWARDFPLVQTGPGAHPASCTMGTGSFPGVKCGRGVLLTTHPLLVLRSWKSRAIPLPTVLGHNGSLTGNLYLYPYGLLQHVLSHTPTKFARKCRCHMVGHPRCVFINYIWLNQLSNTTNLWQIYVYQIGINYMFRLLWPSSG